MRSAIILCLLAACGSDGEGMGTGDVDAGMGSGSGSGSGTPDAPSSGCSNYTPPSLPDSEMVPRDVEALAQIEALSQFTVSGNTTFNSAGKISRFTYDGPGSDND